MHNKGYKKHLLPFPIEHNLRTVVDLVEYHAIHLFRRLESPRLEQDESSWKVEEWAPKEKFQHIYHKKALWRGEHNHLRMYSDELREPFEAPKTQTNIIIIIIILFKR